MRYVVFSLLLTSCALETTDAFCDEQQELFDRAQEIIPNNPCTPDSHAWRCGEQFALTVDLGAGVATIYQVDRYPVGKLCTVSNHGQCGRPLDVHCRPDIVWE